MSDNSALDAQTASALFANMVMQQTNMTLIFLGRTPNPQTGEMIEDLDTAKMLIDQLEMLAVKTRGNLDPRETALMNQSLTAVRMAFVEAVEKGPKISPKSGESAKAEASQPSASESSQASAGPPTAEPKAATASESTSTPPSAIPEQDESRKKFSKKY